ncbi:MAG: porin [Proteobacteria bacterium]|nr:porin [Pseudomonadota bacterium]
MWVVGSLILSQTTAVQAQPAVTSTGLQWMAFSDTYFQESIHNPHERTQFAAHRGAVRYNRFAINCLGVYAQFHSQRFGAKVKITPYETFPGSTCAPFKAYALWTPTPGVELTFGKFPTFFGVEAVESWENFNYTRGAVAVLAQPDAFAGMRLEFRATEKFGMNLLITNGPDLGHDNNQLLSFGAQAVFQPSPYFTAKLGYLGGPEEPESFHDHNTGMSVPNLGYEERWTHRGDLVLEAAIGAVALKLNGVLGVRLEPGRDAHTPAPPDPAAENFFALAASGRISVSDTMSFSLRGEYISDPKRWLYQPNLALEHPFEPLTGYFATVTLEYIPFPDVGNPVIRWDNRFELVSESMYYIGNQQHELSRNWFGSILGIVVHLHG